MTHDASFELDLLTGFNVTRSLLMIIITETDDVMRRCVECIYHVVDSVMRETLLMIPVLEQSPGWSMVARTPGSGACTGSRVSHTTDTDTHHSHLLCSTVTIQNITLSGATSSSRSSLFSCPSIFNLPNQFIFEQHL